MQEAGRVAGGPWLDLRCRGKGWQRQMLRKHFPKAWKRFPLRPTCLTCGRGASSGEQRYPEGWQLQ